MTDNTETVADVLAEMRDRTFRRYYIKAREWADRIERAMAASAVPVATYTTGHCKNNAQPGGCQLHNLQCGYPSCDRQPVIPPAVPVESPPASVPDGFYLASFKHATRNVDVVWWQPDNAGYTPDLEQAGIYTEITPGYHDSEHTVPVPVRFLAGCRIRRTIDPADFKNRAFWSAARLRAAIATTPEESP